MLRRLALAPLAALALFGGVRPTSADEPKKESDWVELLPAGSELDKNWVTKGNWSLDKEGVVTLTPRKGEVDWTRYDMYLWSKKTYGDFEVEFEYKVQKGGNSGFYFRVGDTKTPVEKGIEVQIYDSGSKKPGEKLTDHDSGGVIPGIPPTKNAAKPAGEWNKMIVINRADKLTVKLNGETVNEVDLATNAKLKDRPKVGNIGFQDHGLPLALRNIKVRDLGGK